MSHTWEYENDTILYNSFQQYLDAICDPKSPYGLELYITSTCNQKCEYCYLSKYEDSLYPVEIRDKTLILKNLDIFIDYLIENNKYPNKLDFFTGEIWDNKFGYEVLEKTLRLVKAAYNYGTPIEALMIPSNCSFIFEDKWKQAFDKCIETFQFYDCHLAISCSYDGPLLEAVNRPFKGKDNKIKESEEYGQAILDYGVERNFGYHPMVNAHNIKLWKDQFKWWVDNLVKRKLPFWASIMFLEVRNDEWTEEAIIDYLDYLNSSFDYALEKFYQNNFYDFFKLAGNLIPDDHRDMPMNYNCFSYGLGNYNKGCSVDRMVCIRLGDLAWCPCHRTSYEKLLYGRLKVENDKIVGLKALNIPLFVHINTTSYKGWMKCDVCPLHGYCMTGCFGAQFETNKELFFPCNTVCDLFMAKSIFLSLKYQQLLDTTPEKEKFSESDIAPFKRFSASVNTLPKEVLEKWTKISLSILSTTSSSN